MYVIKADAGSSHHIINAHYADIHMDIQCETGNISCVKFAQSGVLITSVKCISYNHSQVAMEIRRA